MADYPYAPPSLRAQCLNVVDGDTIDLFTDEGKHRFAIERYRLIGIDTYEMNDPDEVKRKLAQEAKAKLVEWLSPTPIKGLVNLTEWPLRVVTHKGDSFGRWLADVYWRDDVGVEHHVNGELLVLGLALPFRR